MNLEVLQGSRFRFLGPNGAGKTTTVRILSGFMKQSSGTATVCGLPLDTKRNEIKAVTGLLPETPRLYSKLSAVEFLEFIGALNGQNGPAFIIAIPLSIIPALVNTFLSATGFETLIFLLIYGYIVICGAIIFATCVTAWNPNYENTKSPEHQMNVIITTMGVQFTIFAPIMISILGDILGLPFWDLIRDTFGIAGMPYAFALISLGSLFIVSGLALLVGTKRLTQPEV